MRTERLALWKRRFQWVADFNEVREESGRLAARAVKVMGDIEQGRVPSK